MVKKTTKTRSVFFVSKFCQDELTNSMRREDGNLLFLGVPLCYFDVVSRILIAKGLTATQIPCPDCYDPFKALKGLLFK